MKRKLLVIVASLCMIFTCMPNVSAVAFAGTGDETASSETQREDKCGYKPVTATPLSPVEIRTRDDKTGLKSSKSPVLNSAPIANLGNDEEDRFCKAYLRIIDSDDGKLLKMYDLIRDGINRYDTQILIEKLPSEKDEYTSKEIWTVFTLVKEDYPELFWLGTGYDYKAYTYDDDETKTEYVEYIQPEYVFSTIGEIESASTAFNSKIDSIISLIEKEPDFAEYTAYDKEQSVHDWLVLNNRYPEPIDEAGNYALHSHTAYSAIITGNPVCEGYTRAFQLLLSKLGVESCTVTGSSDTAETVETPEINHIWNAVKLDDDKWYQVDVTWDDTDMEGEEYAEDISYEYFNIAAEKMEEDHTIINDDFDLPQCTSNDYWYYNVNDRYVVNVKKYQQNNDLNSLAGLIAEFINEYGFARIYVADEFAEENDDKLLGKLYMSSEEGALGSLVAGRMYIEGYYSYVSSQITGREWNLYMDVSDDETKHGKITAADVWDWFYQEGSTNDVVARAYPEGTTRQEMISLIKLECGTEANQDSKSVLAATVESVELDEDFQPRYFAAFEFEGIPLGKYEVALYKPGYPILTYSMEAERGGVSRTRAFGDYAWWLCPFGDVDTDWNVNSGDALIMKRHIANWGGSYDNLYEAAADIDGDGEITLKDVVLLEKHIAKESGYEDLSSYCKAS